MWAATMKQRKQKRKEKSTPFGVNVMTSQVLDCAAQGVAAMHAQLAFACLHDACMQIVNVRDKVRTHP